MTTQYTPNAIDYETLDLIPGDPGVVIVTELSSVDDEIATIALGENSFRFYDTVYTSLTIDANGRIIFGTGESEYSNTYLTSSESTPGIIAPFWDDLITDSVAAEAGTTLDGLILYKIEANRIIIEWSNVHFIDGGETTDGLTFQTILQLNTGETNGNIIFNYSDLTEQELEGNNGTSATIGIKAPGSQTVSSFDRTLVSFDETNPLVGASKAILFTTSFIDPAILVITSGTTVNFAENGTDTVYTVTATAPEGTALTYSLSGIDAALFNIGSNTGAVSFITPPDFELPTDNSANNVYDINVIASDGTLSNSQAVAITVTDVNEIGLTNTTDDIFKIKGDGAKAKLQVTLIERSSNLVNELGVFTVDDDKGTINGIAPGTAGYTLAALQQSKVILSVIANSPNGFNANNLTSILEFNTNDNLRFYLVKNSTSDAVQAGITSTADVLFGDPSNQKLTDLGVDGFSLAWKDGYLSTSDFNDLVVKVQSTNQTLPLGTNLQGNAQGEVIDLRDINELVKADFTVYREAAFNNFVGFYRVTDENGGIDTNGDGQADILTGQAGYTEAAIRGRIAGIDLTVKNQSTATYTGFFQPGSIYAPFIIVDGTPDALLDSNSNNDPAVYFPYLGANSDKVDHIRLLGNNVFGFEDLVNAGDRDFNDVIVQIDLSAVL